MKAGIQISSFAPLMKDVQGLENVLCALNAFNCRYVQLQWIDKAVLPETAGEMCRKLGFVSLGVQDKALQIFEDIGYYIRLNIAAGSDEICVSGIPDSLGFTAYAEKLRGIKSHCADSGIRLSYHPTGTDFADDCAKCNRLLDAFPDIRLCADVCQLNDAGINPEEFIKRNAGRIDIVHFKDRGNDGNLSVVGEGRTDFTPVVRACSEAGVRYLLAEQETWKGDAVQSLKSGFEYINRFLKTTGDN